VRAYATALRNAGWTIAAQQGRGPGGALVVAHYAASGRDVWVRVSAADGGYELAVADAGQSIARGLEAGCSIVLQGVEFEIDEATLLPVSEPTLAAVQRLLRADRDMKLEIDAYTDSRDARGDRDANLRLSAQRAEAVRTWFRQHRVDDDRLVTRGSATPSRCTPATRTSIARAIAASSCARSAAADARRCRARARRPPGRQPTHLRAFANMRAHGLRRETSPPAQLSCTLRSTRSACGISAVKRPSAVVTAVRPPGCRSGSADRPRSGAVVVDEAHRGDAPRAALPRCEKSA
jgi:outer membrane protein OmpA-like peptidoglycan-associated protein